MTENKIFEWHRTGYKFEFYSNLTKGVLWIRKGKYYGDDIHLQITDETYYEMYSNCVSFKYSNSDYMLLYDLFNSIRGSLIGSCETMKSVFMELGIKSKFDLKFWIMSKIWPIGHIYILRKGIYEPFTLRKRKHFWIPYRYNKGISLVTFEHALKTSYES